MADVAVFGLGYVGAVTTAALAALGHNVVGVDTNEAKVAMVASGRSPVVETGLDDLLAAGVAAGRIQAVEDATQAVNASSVSMICVGTPSRGNGSLDLQQVERVCLMIGSALAEDDAYHVVAIRSTMLPGAMGDVVIPALEKESGKTAGVDFGVCVNPEFLREGTSLRDFREPPFTLIGGDDERAVAAIADLYEQLDAELVVTPMRVAEMVKYASNAFHALKVTFANEIGTLCKALDIDSHEVMDVFVRDRALNVSEAYLRPGFAYGGSCLPKDLRALIYQARRLDADVPLLGAIIPSNTAHVERALRLIQDQKRKRIGFLGFSFKAGTDDLRESPIVELIERLIGKGCDVMVYDRNVSLANLEGANRAHIEREIPHIASLMTDSVAGVMAFAEVVVIGNASEEFRDVPERIGDEQVVIDLVRISPEVRAKPGYQGICW
jgi:GDP-mannose 6-dehydrogenase